MATIKSSIHTITLIILRVLNELLSRILKKNYTPGSVLHISFMSHTPKQAVDLLRENGIKADYLAVSDGHPKYADYVLKRSANPIYQSLLEFYYFWSVVARYQIIHSHNVNMLSMSGWEDKYLSRMGRKIVINFRGCDLRTRSRFKELKPEYKICDDCDYDRICEKPTLIRNRERSERIGDAWLVTTPDMLDFLPKASYLPFFTPDCPPATFRELKDGQPINIIHMSNHPGIDGTEYIGKAISNLKNQGYEINYTQLTKVSRTEALEALSEAHLSIGKMKMGFYANSQIESLCHGVPAVTYVRPEFITEELADSGMILTEIETLEETLKRYLDDKELLRQKQNIARSSILRLHDNQQTIQRLIGIYAELIQ